MSHKREQLASVLRRAVQQVLDRGFADPRITGLITITGVAVGHDLREATISVSVMPDEAEALTMHGLRDAARHVRHQVSDLVDTARVPDLRFKLDRSLKDQAAVLSAINKASAELAAKQDRATHQASEDAT